MKKTLLLVFLTVSLNGYSQKGERLLDFLNNVNNAIIESKKQTNSTPSNNTTNSNTYTNSVTTQVNINYKNYFSQNANIANYLYQSGGIMSKIERLLEYQMKIDKPINVYFVDDNTTVGNAYFRPSTNSIYISYDIIKKQSERGYSLMPDVEYSKIVNGVVSYIFLHELAHFMIYNYKMPITGKEENAADQFAIMAMIFASNFEQSFIGYAQFGIVSTFTNDVYVTNRSLVNEHAPTMERYYDMLSIWCGSNKQNAQRFNMIGEKNYQLSYDRFNRSRNEYENAERAWRSLMLPFMK